MCRSVLAKRQWTSLLHFTSHHTHTVTTQVTTFFIAWLETNEWKATAIQSGHVRLATMMAMTTRHKVHTTHFVGNCAGAQALSTRSFSAIAHRLRAEIDTHTQIQKQCATTCEKMWILFNEMTIISARCFYAHEREKKSPLAFAHWLECNSFRQLEIKITHTPSERINVFTTKSPKTNHSQSSRQPANTNVCDENPFNIRSEIFMASRDQFKWNFAVARSI